MVLQNIMMAVALIFLSANCNKPGQDGPPAEPGEGVVEQWLTNMARTQLLQRQSVNLSFSANRPAGTLIEVNDEVTFQSIDGFGYTLTGGSAQLIQGMSAAGRAALLQELFGNGTDAIGVSYLRISMGASDLSPSVFSYNDMPAGQKDENLMNFSLAQDTIHLIPVLKQVLAINSNIKIMATPWSAPAWMKDNGSPIGGSLMPAYYDVYARYFVRYLQAMQAAGITIDAITVQNEPQHGGNNPSMVMSAQEQTTFVRDYLGPSFKAAGIASKIVIWDHNCDNPNFPISVLNDQAARAFINGSAFHLYAGSITALSQVRDAHPDKDIYFTEQWTSSTGNFGGDLMWHMQNVMIGSTRNWAKTALQWNLANDPFMQPHTPGGCTQCLGAVTISGSSYTRNVAFYNIAQFSKFIPTGSKRIQSNAPGNVTQVAFATPGGKKVLVVLNEGTQPFGFAIGHKGKFAAATLPGGTVATYVW